MAMMRRGPLDRYSPEWVLRQANAHQVEGSIEFHTERPMTVFFESGRPYAAELGVNLTENDLVERPTGDEGAARAQAVDLLAGVLAAQSGWYFHDPLGHHPTSGAWAWEIATLLMDIRSRAHETRTLASWTGRTVGLNETSADSVTLGPDAWAIVVALAGSSDAGDLRTRLGWSPDRIAGALSEIEDRGVLAHAPGGGPGGATDQEPWRAAARPLPPPPPRMPTPSSHHTGPLAPPPGVPALQRRLLPTRRTGP